MKCLLVFDHLNDIIYANYDGNFVGYVNQFAQEQGLFEDFEPNSDRVDSNIIMQIFSPVITSQRIMNCQFGNSYTYIKCDKDINICFEEYMGYLFVNIQHEDIGFMKKFLKISICVVRYFCGPDVYQLKMNEKITRITNEVIDAWYHLQSTNQAFLVEAIEKLLVNNEVNSESLHSLQKSVDKLINETDCTKIHALLIVQEKLLSLYSSQNAKELVATDMLFLIILAKSAEIYKTDTENVKSYQILLAGDGPIPKCLPHVVHILTPRPGINLLFLIEIGNSSISSSIYETFCHLDTMQTVQIQQNPETIRPAFDNLDQAVKRLNENLKKTKNNTTENCYKDLTKKWEIIRKKYLEFIRNDSNEALLRAETLALGFLENLKQLLTLTSVDESVLKSSQKYIQGAADVVNENLDVYGEFLSVKAARNCTLESYSLTINKYLEEFPGLVHFIYIDRNNHRMVAPTLYRMEDETNIFTKKKIWNMISFTHRHLQEGTLAMMWKDTAFNYAYFLWFEDNCGTPLKPTIHPTNSNKVLIIPGILDDDFYMRLKEVCFPKTSSHKIRCYELYCIHLGLVTSSCVLEHTRRLAATISELRGHSVLPTDLL